MHRLFSEELEKYEVKPDLTEAIKIELESTYHELNKNSVEKEAILKARIVELTKDIETLEEKHFIKKEMPKETYDRFRVKYTKEFDKIRKEIPTCGISISNLKEIINEAVILCRNLRQLWQDGGIALKEGLQNLLFPNGLVYDRKIGAFRTSEINFIIAQIARHTGDFATIKKGLSSLFEPKSLSAERTLLIPNLKPLNELEISRLEKAISPHKIDRADDETSADILARDLIAVNEFLHYVEAEPFVTPEKAENHKRVAFKKAAGVIVA